MRNRKLCSNRYNKTKLKKKKKNETGKNLPDKEFKVMVADTH